MGVLQRNEQMSFCENMFEDKLYFAIDHNQPYVIGISLITCESVLGPFGWMKYETLLENNTSNRYETYIGGWYVKDRCGTVALRCYKWIG